MSGPGASRGSRPRGGRAGRRARCWARARRAGRWRAGAQPRGPRSSRASGRGGCRVAGCGVASSGWPGRAARSLQAESPGGRWRAGARALGALFFPRIRAPWISRSRGFARVASSRWPGRAARSLLGQGSPGWAVEGRSSSRADSGRRRWRRPKCRRGCWPRPAHRCSQRRRPPPNTAGSAYRGGACRPRRAGRVAACRRVRGLLAPCPQVGQWLGLRLRLSRAAASRAAASKTSRGEGAADRAAARDAARGVAGDGVEGGARLLLLRRVAHPHPATRDVGGQLGLGLLFLGNASSRTSGRTSGWPAPGGTSVASGQLPGRRASRPDGLRASSLCQARVGEDGRGAAERIGAAPSNGRRAEVLRRRPRRPRRGALQAAPPDAPVEAPRRCRGAWEALLRRGRGPRWSRRGPPRDGPGDSPCGRTPRGRCRAACPGGWSSPSSRRRSGGAHARGALVRRRGAPPGRGALPGLGRGEAQSGSSATPASSRPGPGPPASSRARGHHSVTPATDPGLPWAGPRRRRRGRALAAPSLPRCPPRAPAALELAFG